MKRNLNFAIELSLLFFLHCGYYSFSGSTLQSNIRTIAIPTFENKTAEFGVPEGGAGPVGGRQSGQTLSP